MAYKMKHTDGKKASPAKFFGGAATSLVTTGMKESLKAAGKKALKTVAETGIKAGLKTGVKKGVTELAKKGLKTTIGETLKKGLSKNTATGMGKAFQKGLSKKPLSLQEQILAKSKDKGISLSDSAKEIKGVEPKVKKSKVKVDKPDPKKKTFGEKLIDQGLSTAGDIATHVATQVLTPKEEKVINPAENFSQMRFGNYPS